VVILLKSKALERTGIVGLNKSGTKMVIWKYNNINDIFVKFEKGNPIHTNWGNFLRGEVKSPYDRTVQGIGYTGEGIYKTSVNNKDTPQYRTWTGILKRCYNEKFHNKYPTYKQCYVCEEWLNFQNFAKWFDENYYQIDGERMALDKDILLKRNKEYSSDTCIFVPEFINNLFVKNNATRGQLPIGVSIIKDKLSPYQARCRNAKRKNVTIGYYKTPEDAFGAYKKFKENVIKQIANDYKDKIPNKLFVAMMEYTVDIND
jgi:hypothetical protein